MGEYDNEKWVALYLSAVMEFQQSLMAGRILEARAGIAARLEKLRTIPGLHAEERQALEDAVHGLLTLEREDARPAKAALEKLQLIRPRIARLGSQRPGLG